MEMTAPFLLLLLTAFSIGGGVAAVVWIIGRDRIPPLYATASVASLCFLYHALVCWTLNAGGLPFEAVNAILAFSVAICYILAPYTWVFGVMVFLQAVASSSLAVAIYMIIRHQETRRSRTTPSDASSESAPGAASSVHQG